MKLRDNGPFTNDVREKLRKVDIGWGGGGWGVPYQGDSNHDALKRWGEEKPNEEKLLLRPADHLSLD